MSESFNHASCNCCEYRISDYEVTNYYTPINIRCTFNYRTDDGDCYLDIELDLNIKL